MADIGLNITAKENISQVAPQATQALRNMAQASEEVSKALDLKEIEPQWKAYIEKVEQLHTLQEANKRETQREEIQQRSRQQVSRVPESLISKTGGAFAQVGRTGDVVEAGAGVTGMLGGMLGALGPAGTILAITSVGVLAANALSKQYEAVLPSIMSLTAALGELEDSAKETGESFKTTRQEISQVAEGFGYSLQTGLAVSRTIAEISGAGRGQAIGAMGNVMQYARGYGIEPGALARYRAMGIRFGEGDRWGNVLGIAAGGLQQAGMGAGQYQEFLNATLSIFEQGISQGIVQGFEDINVAQSWIAQLGDAFKGQYGINLYNKMQGAMAGATNLSTETDVLMFRAAKRMIEGLSPAERKKMGVGSPENYIEVMKSLEMGARTTPAIFGSMRDMMEEMTGGRRSDMVELFRQVYKVNYTVAEKLIDLGEAEAIRELEAAKADSPQMRLLSVQERLRNSVIGVGEEVSRVKEATISGSIGIIEAIKAMAMGGVPESGLGGLPTPMGGAETPGYLEFTRMKRDIRGLWGGKRGRKQGLKTYGQRALDIVDVMDMLSTEEQAELAKAGFFQRAFEVALANFPEAERRATKGERAMTGYDIEVVFRELINFIKLLGIKLDEDRIMNIYNEVE